MGRTWGFVDLLQGDYLENVILRYGCDTMRLGTLGV